jgi:hypothetical protein
LKNEKNEIKKEIENVNKKRKFEQLENAEHLSPSYYFELMNENQKLEKILKK